MDDIREARINELTNPEIITGASYLKEMIISNAHALWVGYRTFDVVTFTRSDNGKCAGACLVGYDSDGDKPRTLLIKVYGVTPDVLKPKGELMFRLERRVSALLDPVLEGDKFEGEQVVESGSD